MTTLLQEFEQWLKKQREENTFPYIVETLKLAIDKLEELKKKHNTEKWTMPEEAFRWLKFQHEYKTLKEKYKID